MLVLTRKPEQSIMVGSDIEIMILEVRGEQVRVGIRAPRTVSIHRKEVFDQIREANLSAADGGPADLIELAAILPSAGVRPALAPSDPPSES